ncbi:DJ-1/PfpI family protein [Sesbania bispinosa]|nr:DJ-1/PfpI family protein [Sesbania bispinosa]
MQKGKWRAVRVSYGMELQDGELLKGRGGRKRRAHHCRNHPPLDVVVTIARCHHRRKMLTHR